jgi:SAM-dependent methyltransferase
MMQPGRDTYWPDFGKHFDSSVSNPIWRRFSDALVQDWLIKHLPPAPLTAVLKTDLFEEAVGAGIYPLLESLSERVFAIDLSGPVCRRAASRYEDLFVLVSDVRQLALRPASFDLIVSISTLDHFETQSDIQAALAQLFSALKPGGLFLVTLDNPANPVVRLRNAMPWEFLKRLGLVPYPTGATVGTEEFQKLLECTGFRVSAATTLLHVPRSAAILMARLVSHLPGTGPSSLFSKGARMFEALGHLPTAPLTGYYTAFQAQRPGNGSRT